MERKKSAWRESISRTHNCIYWYNEDTKESSWTRPPELGPPTVEEESRAHDATKKNVAAEKTMEGYNPPATVQHRQQGRDRPRETPTQQHHYKNQHRDEKAFHEKLNHEEYRHRQGARVEKVYNE